MKRFVIPIILFAISLAVFTFQSSDIGLEFKGDENFYVQSSRQMMASGDWVTPYYFKKPRFEKPPLYYWIVSSFYKTFGMNWGVARLPSAISMSLVVVLAYLFGLRFFNRDTGLLAALIMISTIATFRYARLVLPESFSLLLLCATIYLMLKGSFLPAYILMGLAVLVKGPVGMILPLFIIAGYKYSIGEKKIFEGMGLLRGLLVVLLISLPWFLIMINIHGKVYIDHVFLRETIQRIGNFDLGSGSFLKMVLKFFKSIFYFLPVIFIFFLPHSLLVIHAVKETSDTISQKGRYSRGAILSFVWFFATLIFFTFLGEKHRHYMLLLSLPFSIMVGSYLYGLYSSKRRKIALSILISFLLFFFIFEAAKLVMAKEIGGIATIFAGKSYNIEEEDLVGIGSHRIVAQEAEVYTGHAVERFYYKWPPEMQEECDKENRIALNNTLFGTKQDAFLLISRRDYEKYATEANKKRLTIIDKGYMYSKGAAISDVLNTLRRLDREAILDLFREEVYFVTNKDDYVI
ncbi:MAG: glycosyltransferase family 39 protein [Candidatus Omnitrophica bacterium]|nr:glycosyltransferase family 39 protein [Candidatus Omnitrophota bacterium]